MKTHRGKKVRNRSLKILNAILKGDYDLAKALRGKGKKPGRLVFTSDREFPDHYRIFGDKSEFSEAQMKMLFTKDEARQMAEDYGGIIFVNYAAKKVKDIPKEELHKLATQPKTYDEKIIVGLNGVTHITDTHQTPKPGEKVKINVTIK